MPADHFFSGSIGLEVAGEKIELLASKALHWPARKLIAVADLHWGKSETFRTFGIPIPPGILTQELAKLSEIVRRVGAEKVLVLGDLIHGVKGLTPQVLDEVGKFTKALPAKLVLIRGNHDRTLPQDILNSWQIESFTAPYGLGPFRFVHEPEESAGFPELVTGTAPSETYSWAGHLHPTVEISGGADYLRLDCFHLGSKVGILPAFSGFTRGIKMERRKGDRIYAVAEGSLIQI